MNKPPPIKDEDFEAGRLTHKTYNFQDLSKLTIKNVRRLSSGEMTPRQKDALVRLGKQDLGNLGIPFELSERRKYFDIFNDLFFGGLVARCKFRTHQSIGDESAMLGWFDIFPIPGDDRDAGESVEECVISIMDHSFWWSPDHPLAAGRKILELILHEQVHALFGIYDEECCWISTSHCIEWLAAALAIEQEATKLFGWEVDLQRYQNLVNDVLEEGAILPNAAVLSALDLDIVLILKMLEHGKAMAAEKLREAKRFALPLKGNKCIAGVCSVDNWESGFQRDKTWLPWSVLPL